MTIEGKTKNSSTRWQHWWQQLGVGGGDDDGDGDGDSCGSGSGSGSGRGGIEEWCYLCKLAFDLVIKVVTLRCWWRTMGVA